MFINKIKIVLTIMTAAVFFVSFANAQVQNSKQHQPDKFRQLDESWPTPNDQRIASGESGPEYWPRRHVMSRLELFKFNQSKSLMEKADVSTNYNN